MKLAPTFAYNPNPSPPPPPPGPPPPPPSTDDVGLLEGLEGTWFGKGFNAIWRPNALATGQDRFLEFNVTEETLEFSPIKGAIPNRGLLQPDITMGGLWYLARRTSRRSFLMKAVMAGSAFASAPVQYLLKPQSALATPSDDLNCGPTQKCEDGYTEFCCTVNDSASARNVCPPYAYVGGWWRACSETYSGRYMCEGRSRFFMDCNLIPGNSCAPHCSHNDCTYRAVCKNDFRYGNCHAGNGYGTTPVVCRLISCKPPYDYTGGCFNCNRTFFADYNTCNHESSCYCGQCADPANMSIGSCGDGCC